MAKEPEIPDQSNQMPIIAGEPREWSVSKLPRGAQQRFIQAAISMLGGVLEGGADLRSKGGVNVVGYSNVQYKPGVVESYLSSASDNPIRLHFAMEESVKVKRRLSMIDECVERLDKNTNVEDTPSDDGAIEPEWMDQFKYYSDFISSKKAKAAFSEVLSREIMKPGQFSKKALRYLFEMDRNVAEEFSRIYSEYGLGNFLFIPDNKKKEFFNSLFSLKSENLIDSISDSIYVRFFPMDGTRIIDVRLKDYALMFYIFDHEKRPDFNIDCIGLTHTGSEISKLIDRSDPDLQLRLLKNVYPHITIPSRRIAIHRNTGSELDHESEAVEVILDFGVK
ncbi:DUF2806 domain-containing protein [Xanthobacter sp.]|uniref:DUF2806 domain-containing protein n=1 Tax=Xanthobacter sp. TaxID=35809 RepID=UPI0025DB507F|nr:DUF2806 domain-containing protein [Xanthobacter sp.]